MLGVEKELRAARARLLDLTMRNGLLNYRPTSGRSIRVVGATPQECYDALIVNEKHLQFSPKPEATNASNPKSVPDGRARDRQAATPPPRHSPVDRHLQTDLDDERLQRRLVNLAQQAKSFLEEQGYGALYLALGFLEWMEAPGSEPRHAPLVLVPVELERLHVGAAFRLRWSGEEVACNLSLQAKLAEQNIKLPELDADGTDVNAYLRLVARAVRHMGSWQILNEIYLDIFSFTKFVMYKDLDPAAWPSGSSPADHPLVRAILDPNPDEPCDSGFREDEADEQLEIRQVFHVMDADPSQIAVIEDAKAGRNLAVEGPPGTGKSQTIANIIAELLAANKKVLFVSEKMAALEVVKARLDKVGLSDFCLELHSRKTNKKDLLKELQRSLESAPVAPGSSESEFREFEAYRRQLNAYAAALREPVGKTGLSPFQLFGVRETARAHFSRVERDSPRVLLPNALDCDADGRDRARAALVDLEDVLRLVRPLAEHPWRQCEPVSATPRDEQEIASLLDECLGHIGDIESALRTVTETCGTACPSQLRPVADIVDAAVRVASIGAVEEEVLTNPSWEGPNGAARNLISLLAEYQQRRALLLTRLRAESLNDDPRPLLQQYQRLCFKVYRFMSRSYRHTKRLISDLYAAPPPKHREEILDDLGKLVDCWERGERLRELEAFGRAQFGARWKGTESSVVQLQELADFMDFFRHALASGVLTPNAIGLAAHGITEHQVTPVIAAIHASTAGFQDAWTRLTASLNTSSERLFGDPVEVVSFETLRSQLTLWKECLPTLHIWAQYLARRQALLATAAAPIADLVAKDMLEPEDLIECFNDNLAKALLDAAFADRPALREFVGELHEKKISRFADLDRQLIQLNRKRLLATLYQRRPTLTGGVSPHSEAGILLGEFNRKRGHMPIRKLMSLAGSLVQQIKPCFMMSPLSLAQFLDPKCVRFDVVIFDEASQVRPEDALGALLRAGQAVIMGDTRQLPPTTFFDHMITGQDHEDSDEAASIADMESILHHCRRSFMTKTLRWHYRSRHQSLIAVSNQEYYGNQLLIYPSPIQRDGSLGLHFVHLPRTTYDRGHSRVNREEAREVAKRVIEHLETHPQKSLGVGTFNVEQQRAILDEIERLLLLRPTLEKRTGGPDGAGEPLFVKNLETIQGDERDVIFISVGYGFDGARRLTTNFGPVNNDGGERRLNVLFTRARERCVVFANFRAADLPLPPDAPLGLRILKQFLQYAETGQFMNAGVSQVDGESPFEDSVYRFLSDHHYEVHRQVGAAGFRVDLAVVDPKHRGRYILGIECDGVPYHSSRVARERDRLRQEILENLGWQIYRVWSTDWYRDRTKAQRKLLDAIEAAKAPQPRGRPRRPASIANLERDPRDGSPAAGQTSTQTRSTAATPLTRDYEICQDLPIPTWGELHDVYVGDLSKAVTHIVEVEGPVHFDEVVRRLRSLWGLRRAGDRIREAVARAARFAERNHKVVRRGDFLWPPGMTAPPVRRRLDDPPAKIELICEEEIAEAVKVVLNTQFATAQDDLILRVSRLLGFQATHQATAARIKLTIARLMETGALKLGASGMIDLVRR